MSGIKKGNFRWLIVNYWGNYWNGTKFIMHHSKAKQYKTHGKAMLCLDLAKATIDEKCYKKHVTIKKIDFGAIASLDLNFIKTSVAKQ